MTDEREVRLRDGRSATIRTSRGLDAPGQVALDLALAEDGRGMVLTRDQVRSVEEERLRIDDLYRRISGGDGSLMVVADVDGVILASGELRHLRQRRCDHVGIFSLGVHPQAQRLGLGRAVMEHLIEHARAVGLRRLELYTRDDNPRARSLYESLGFVTEGVRRGFVRLEDGTLVDDLIMVRWI